MTSNLLQAILNRENADRKVALAVKEDSLAEHRRLVSALHEAYAPYELQVAELVLKGDYGRPVVFGARDEASTKVRVSTGLDFLLGPKLYKVTLRLVVTAREGATPAQVELCIERQYPYHNERLARFDAHTPPAHLLEKTFEVLASYLDDSSFTDEPERLAA